ncbi:uncharacterized protein SCHCODRAFT_02718591, partial [Schizophyllum commune H4-8]|uniref:uncharacterized protein n=1 Tax=Schizophyllum commune (strain H4-8 / FGSC 9210) TaxID=578458 RepID=UPI00215F0031
GDLASIHRQHASQVYAGRTGSAAPRISTPSTGLAQLFSNDPAYVQPAVNSSTWMPGGFVPTPYTSPYPNAANPYAYGVAPQDSISNHAAYSRHAGGGEPPDDEPDDSGEDDQPTNRGRSNLPRDRDDASYGRRGRRGGNPSPSPPPSDDDDGRRDPRRPPRVPRFAPSSRPADKTENKESRFDMKLKISDVPAWNGSEETIAKWISKINALSRESKTIFKQLGIVVPKRLTGSAEAWFWSLEEAYRAEICQDWSSLRHAIASYYKLGTRARRPASTSFAKWS